MDDIERTLAEPTLIRVHTRPLCVAYAAHAARLDANLGLLSASEHVSNGSTTED